MALPRCDTWPHAVKTPIRLGAALVGGRLRWLRPQAFQRGAGLVLAGFAVWMGFNALAA